MIYKKYVDDNFVLFSSKEYFQLLVDYMNTQHKCIKFSSEIEHDNVLLFCDLKITYYNQQFKTSVHRKPVFSGIFTQYKHYLDQSKKSLIDNLLFRCFLICSDHTLFHLEFENLREILKRNSYPSGIKEQSIKSFLKKLYVLRKLIPTVPKGEFFTILPYQGNMPSNLRRKLRTCFKYSLPQCNIEIILQSTNCLSSLFHFKDVFHEQLVYKL